VTKSGGSEKTLIVKQRHTAAWYKKKSTPYFFIFPTVILMAILLVIPVAMVIRYSFFDNVIINKHPVFVGFDNFVNVLTDKTFKQAIGNTLFFVIFSIIWHIVVGMTFALLLNTRYLNRTTKSIFRVLYSLPWMFTASVIAITWRMMFNPNGIINYFLQNFGWISKNVEWLGDRGTALAAVTFINCWSGYPFYMISILAGLQGISTELYEAAALDGAGTVQTFFHITIPQLKPILLSLIMLDFVWTLQQFALIWMTTGGGPVGASETIATYIYKQGFTKFQYSTASAAAVLLLLVCTVIAVFYVRQQKSEA